MSDNNIFSDILNYNEPTQEVVPAEGALVEIKTDLQEDFDQARKNLKEIADISQEAISEFARMTKQLQDPRAYGTLSKMIASAILAQKAVVEVHKNKQEGKDPNEADIPVQHVTHNTLVMTTDQMLKMLEDRKNTNG
jgi:hypothetical protein